MNCPYKASGNDGFTLVELLVTILIIVILSVTMLPLLKPFVTQAQYAAEAVPVIGNVRTKVELYRIENDRLPGVPLDSNGDVQNDETAKYATSDLKNKAPISAAEPTKDGVQSFIAGEDSDGVSTYLPSLAGEEFTDDANDPQLGNHVWNKIGINYADFTGKKLRPSTMQYLVLKSKGDAYCWVIACFGDGALAKGCGYAVMEYNNPELKRKFVATFEVYKPLSAEQLQFAVTTGDPSGTKDDFLKNGYVYLPDMDTLEGAVDAEAAEVVDTAKGYLGKMGWSLN